MGKPEDIPQDAWDYSAAVEHVFCGCAPGRARGNGTNHHDSCWKKVEAHARAILAAKAEERDSIAEMVDVFADTADFSGMNVEYEHQVLQYRHEESVLKGIAAAIRKRGEG